MGACGSKGDPEQVARNKAIEKELQLAKEESAKEVKMLLLGMFVWIVTALAGTLWASLYACHMKCHIITRLAADVIAH